jgi:hypothetical protein
MTPKERYDERRRLRADRLLREERRAADANSRDDDMAAQLTRTMLAFERVADVLELWADQQST